jgi:hypothetical protein
MSTTGLLLPVKNYNKRHKNLKINTHYHNAVSSLEYIPLPKHYLYNQEP